MTNVIVAIWLILWISDQAFAERVLVEKRSSVLPGDQREKFSTSGLNDLVVEFSACHGNRPYILLYLCPMSNRRLKVALGQESTVLWNCESDSSNNNCSQIAEHLAVQIECNSYSPVWISWRISGKIQFGTGTEVGRKLYFDAIVGHANCSGITEWDWGTEIGDDTVQMALHRSEGENRCYLTRPERVERMVVCGDVYTDEAWCLSCGCCYDRLSADQMPCFYPQVDDNERRKNCERTFEEVLGSVEFRSMQNLDSDSNADDQTSFLILLKQTIKTINVGLNFGDGTPPLDGVQLDSSTPIPGCPLSGCKYVDWLRTVVSHFYANAGDFEAVLTITDSSRGALPFVLRKTVVKVSERLETVSLVSTVGETDETSFHLPGFNPVLQEFRCSRFETRILYGEDSSSDDSPAISEGRSEKQAFEGSDDSLAFKGLDETLAFAGNNGSIGSKENNGSITLEGNNGSIAFKGNNGSIGSKENNGSITLEGNNGSIAFKGNNGSIGSKENNGSITLEGSNGSIALEGNNGSSAFKGNNESIPFEGKNETLEFEERNEPNAVKELNGSPTFEGRSDSVPTNNWNGSLTFESARNITFRAAIESECFPSLPRYIISWSLRRLVTNGNHHHDDDDDVLHRLVSSSTRFNIPSHSLSRGTYEVHLEVRMFDAFRTPINISNAMATFNVLLSKEDGIISYHFLNGTVSLTNDIHGPGLSYQWICTTREVRDVSEVETHIDDDHPFGHCMKDTASAKTLIPSARNQLFPASFLRFSSLPASYYFHSIIRSSRTEASSILSTTLTIVELLPRSSPPSVYIRCITGCSRPHSKSNPIWLEGGCDDCGGNAELLSYDWTFDYAQQSNAHLRSFDWDEDSATGNGRSYVVVYPDKFMKSVAQDEFSFTVTVTQEDMTSSDASFHYGKENPEYDVHQNLTHSYLKIATNDSSYRHLSSNVFLVTTATLLCFSCQPELSLYNMFFTL